MCGWSLCVFALHIYGRGIPEACFQTPPPCSGGGGGFVFFLRGIGGGGVWGLRFKTPPAVIAGAKSMLTEISIYDIALWPIP